MKAKATKHKKRMLEKARGGGGAGALAFAW